jgi:diguanylate cyclase (GGDEF)-like protein
LQAQKLLSFACRLATLKPDKINDACREFLPSLMGARRVSGYRFNPAKSRLELGWCVPDEPVAQYISISPFRSDSPISLAVNRRQAWYAKDVTEALAELEIAHRRPHADRYETGSCIVAPVVYGAELLGVLNFADPIDGDVFERRKFEPLVEGLTHLLAATWQNVGTVESLEQLARTDGLTGLANFRAFEETITREVTRARRYGLPLSLILMDVDNLKQVNDRFGHPAGDLLLREVARRVSEAIRETDVAARQGGDEFSVVLPNTTLGATGQVAARIEEAVNGSQVQWLRHVFETSVSMAFGQYDGQSSVSGFVTEVDSRLYRSKSFARVAL